MLSCNKENQGRRHGGIGIHVQLYKISYSPKIIIATLSRLKKNAITIHGIFALTKTFTSYLPTKLTFLQKLTLHVLLTLTLKRR